MRWWRTVFFCSRGGGYRYRFGRKKRQNYVGGHNFPLGDVVVAGQGRFDWEDMARDNAGADAKEEGQKSMVVDVRLQRRDNDMFTRTKSQSMRWTVKILAIGLAAAALGLVAVMAWLGKVSRETETNEPSWTELVKQLNDPNAKVRSHAARQLGDLELRGMDAVPSLWDALKDSDRRVRIEAACALILIDKGQWDVAIPVLVTELKDAPDPDLREGVLGLLDANPKLLDHPEITPTLIILLSSKEPEIQDRSYRFLAKMKLGKEVAPRLSQLLHDFNPKTRTYAALLIGEITNAAKECLPVFRRLLEDTHTHVRLAAAVAILKVDPKDKPAQEVLLRAINDQDTDMRLTAAETILMHLDSADVRAIQSVRNDLKKLDSQKQSVTLVRLSHLADQLDKPDPIVRLIAESLENSDEDVRLVSVR